MAKITRSFTAGKMNKVLDTRFIPNGEYIDAMNVRVVSTENDSIGTVENTVGNEVATPDYLRYVGKASVPTGIDGTLLSVDAKCIGAITDSANNLIYWFIHDSNFIPTNSPAPPNRKLDLIVSFNTVTSALTYHVTSISFANANTLLNFNTGYLITGINIVGDLLFFSDGLNPPRVINTKRSYSVPSLSEDTITAESLLVIKKPPVNAPLIMPIQTSGQENFLETRFICFAYRYKYIDGEYSATSQWSEPSFVPKGFNFSFDSNLNEGMVNYFNSCVITYDSGGPLVVGVDLLFKKSSSNIIKVIEKLNKKELGISDNTQKEYVFTNSKIFTILPDSELLRLYDNVPRFAKAQTIMGNRLVYGNYVEGYDLTYWKVIGITGQQALVPIELNYYTSLVSKQADIVDAVTVLGGSGTYSINGAHVVLGSVALGSNINSSPAGGQIPLKAGSSISFVFTFTHDSYTVGNPSYTAPDTVTTPTTIEFIYFLQNNFTDITSVTLSPDFISKIGTALNIQTVQNAANGVTFTDIFNASVPNTQTRNSPLTTFYKYASGITPLTPTLQPWAFTGLGGFLGGIFATQLLAMQYVDDLISPTEYIYEYYKCTKFTMTLQDIGVPKSLHSNRDYEVGIVYMDEFSRSTTALTSLRNTVHTDCGTADKQNSIQVTIPKGSHPPYWAKKYKFVIKSDKEGYETVYSRWAYDKPLENSIYVLLEGENARKVEIGDRLVLKKDGSPNAASTCTDIVVLDKQAYATSYFVTDSAAGVYMRVANSNMSVSQGLPAMLGQQLSMTTTASLEYSTLNYVVSFFNGTPIPITQGAKIHIKFSNKRPGETNNCAKREFEFDLYLTSSADYPSFEAWWAGDNIIGSGVLNTGAGYPGPYYNLNMPAGAITPAVGTIEWRPSTVVGPFGPYSVLSVGGIQSCDFGYVLPGISNNRPAKKATMKLSISITYPNATMIFETQPSEALPDIFFENEKSFDIVNGYHTGNLQNQTATLPAIIDTGFFNCYSFGNGAESYKVRDSIVENDFKFGNRVTAVAAQDYKEAKRTTDLTYSGVFNPESNVNKLNAFNLGLLNYKYLEQSFGNIMRIEGRETDILVLQENKISYVLAGKNLLSDAAAGGVIVSVPEVLGTQIARIEKYGISHNPESFVQFGAEKYFTDAKRGAVICLTGTAYSNEDLKIVSDMGMGSWFNTEFALNTDLQCLGGYDPYMNEYILSFNGEFVIPAVGAVNAPPPLSSGQAVTLPLGGVSLPPGPIALGPSLGNVVVSWQAHTTTAPIAEYMVSTTYNGTLYSSGMITEAEGSFTVNKNSITEDVITIVVESGLVENPNDSLLLLVSPPEPEVLNVIEIVLTTDVIADETIHQEYSFEYELFSSPTQSNLAIFNSRPVSVYRLTTGVVGFANMPPARSILTLRTSKILSDNFNNKMGKFGVLRSTTLYLNTEEDITSLIATTTFFDVVSENGDILSTDFTVPESREGEYLYLIYDLRNNE